MKYKVREGIILRNICGEWLLIATGDASRHCMYVRQINETLAWYWQQIEKGQETEAVIEEAESCFEVPRARIEKDFRSLIDQLCSMGYLVGTDDEMSE